MTPVGVEPTITWMKARCPRPLDDGAVAAYFNKLLDREVDFKIINPIKINNSEII